MMLGTPTTTAEYWGLMLFRRQRLKKMLGVLDGLIKNQGEYPNPTCLAARENLKVQILLLKLELNTQY